MDRFWRYRRMQAVDGDGYLHEEGLASPSVMSLSSSASLPSLAEQRDKKQNTTKKNDEGEGETDEERQEEDKATDADGWTAEDQRAWDEFKEIATKVLPLLGLSLGRVFAVRLMDSVLQGYFRVLPPP